MELTRSGVESGLDRTEADGGDWLCRVVAAAAVNPREERMEEKGNRRKAEENRLPVLTGLGKRDERIDRESGEREGEGGGQVKLLFQNLARRRGEEGRISDGGDLRLAKESD